MPTRPAPLGSYGGPTQTMALMPASGGNPKSPAIGMGSAPVGSKDQRGFPLDTPKPDIGAFQFQPSYATNPVALVVNTTSDSQRRPGTLSLRQAVNLANAFQGATSITFDPTVFARAQTITLTAGFIELTDSGGPVTITGPKAGVTINGGGANRDFQVDGSGITPNNPVTAFFELDPHGGQGGPGRRHSHWRDSDPDQLHHHRQHGATNLRRL